MLSGYHTCQVPGYRSDIRYKVLNVLTHSFELFKVCWVDQPQSRRSVVMIKGCNSVEMWTSPLYHPVVECYNCVRPDTFAYTVVSTPVQKRPCSKLNALGRRNTFTMFYKLSACHEWHRKCSAVGYSLEKICEYWCCIYVGSVHSRSLTHTHTCTSHVHVHRTVFA